MYVFHCTHGFPHRSPAAWLPSSRLVRVKKPVREVSPQSSSESFSESDQEEPVGMNQTPPTGAYRTQSVGAATINTAAQHVNPKLILPSLCANDYYQPALISLLQNILNPQRKSFVLSYKPRTWIFLQGDNSYTPVLIVPAGGRLMYHSLGRKVHSNT